MHLCAPLNETHYINRLCVCLIAGLTEPSVWIHKQFYSWCRKHHLSMLPAGKETLDLHVADIATADNPATLNRYVAAISQRLQRTGWESPTKDSKVRVVMLGIRRNKFFLLLTGT
jgi:hypothetical protein